MENINYLCSLREFELNQALPSFPSPNEDGEKYSVLEIGAGTGHQAKILAQLGFDVIAIDVPDSAYRDQQVHPIIEFDGQTLPISTGSIRVVFSSNVLEHIRDIDAFLDEMNRVIAPGGVAIHILPTPAWRLWTILGHYGWLTKKLVSLLRVEDSGGATKRISQPVKIFSRFIGALFPQRHGERGMTLTEIFYYSHWWWKRKFESHHWQVSTSYPTGIFYTGAEIFASCLPNSQRQKLARWLGSACRVYVLHRS